MEKMIEREFVCKFCNKKFPSGKSLGGHIMIHTNQYSLSYNPKKIKMLVDHREITPLKQQQQQEQELCCRECGKGCNHMDCCHSEGGKMVMDSQSDTETTSSGPTMKRSKRLMKLPQSLSNNGSSSSASEIDQEHKDMALSLMMMSVDSKGHNLVMNSLADSSENNSEVLKTKASSGEEQLNMIFSVKNQDINTDQLRSHGDDSYSSDSDYFMNGPKKSDSDISVDRSLSNTEFNRFRNGDELGVKERGSKYELSKSKRVLSSYESDSCKVRRCSDSKSPMVKKASGCGANKNSKVHECSICFKVFKSGQALGGHKRSHSIDSHEHRIKHNAAAVMRIDLNLPAQDIDE